MQDTENPPELDQDHRAICHGTRPADWQRVLDIAENPAVTPYLGLHPWYIEEAADDWCEQLAKQLKQTSAGIGEVGLDKAVDVDFSQQLQVFEQQLKLARELARPVCIHCVKAWDVLKGEFGELLSAIRFYIHSFNTSTQIMKQLVELGAFISFGTALHDPMHKKLRNTFLHTPNDRILLETDLPYFPGAPKDAPTDIPGLYQRAAELKGMAAEDLAQAIQPERFER